MTSGTPQPVRNDTEDTLENTRARLSRSTSSFALFKERKVRLRRRSESLRRGRGVTEAESFRIRVGRSSLDSNMRPGEDIFVEGFDDQEYYWSSGWQQAEREAEEEINRGDVIEVADAEEAIRWLRKEDVDE